MDPSNMPSSSMESLTRWQKYYSFEDTSAASLDQFVIILWLAQGIETIISESGLTVILVDKCLFIESYRFKIRGNFFKRNTLRLIPADFWEVISLNNGNIDL